jgi:hypothetical protein
MGRRLQILLALFAGAIFGSASTGCFALWVGLARADGPASNPGQVMTVPCLTSVTMPGATSPSTVAVASFPGATKEDLQASVWLVPQAAPPEYVAIDGVSYMIPGLVRIGPPAPGANPWALVADGSVAVVCATGVTSVNLYVR